MLPDGSMIWLNAGSEVRYRNTFKSREVHLVRGEAFFDVQKDPGHPFQVITDGSRTTVLGTRFNLRLDGVSRDVVLFVEEGIVTFEDRKGMVPRQSVERGEGAILHAGGRSIEKLEDGDINTISWKTQHLVFDHTELREVIPMIENFFGIEIEVSNPGTLDCHFRSTFDQPTLSEVLETLRISLNATIAFSDSTWVITAPACQNPDRQ
jgi:ferric-dicitrate binding protein FerR (iron transport regulator)